MRARVTAGARANRMRLIENQKRSGPPRQFAQRGVKSRIGMNDADVGHRRLGKHARHVTPRERFFECVEIVEFHHTRGLRRIYWRADISTARNDSAILERGERFIHLSLIHI